MMQNADGNEEEDAKKRKTTVQMDEEISEDAWNDFFVRKSEVKDDSIPSQFMGELAMLEAEARAQYEEKEKIVSKEKKKGEKELKKALKEKEQRNREKLRQRGLQDETAIFELKSTQRIMIDKLPGTFNLEFIFRYEAKTSEILKVIYVKNEKRKGEEELSGLLIAERRPNGVMIKYQRKRQLLENVDSNSFNMFLDPIVGSFLFISYKDTSRGVNRLYITNFDHQMSLNEDKIDFHDMSRDLKKQSISNPYITSVGWNFSQTDILTKTNGKSSVKNIVLGTDNGMLISIASIDISGRNVDVREVRELKVLKFMEQSEYITGIQIFMDKKASTKAEHIDQANNEIAEKEASHVKKKHTDYLQFMLVSTKERLYQFAGVSTDKYPFRFVITTDPLRHLMKHRLDSGAKSGPVLVTRNCYLSELERIKKARKKNKANNTPQIQDGLDGFAALTPGGILHGLIDLEDWRRSEVEEKKTPVTHWEYIQYNSRSLVRDMLKKQKSYPIDIAVSKHHIFLLYEERPHLVVLQVPPPVCYPGREEIEMTDEIVALEMDLFAPAIGFAKSDNDPDNVYMYTKDTIRKINITREDRVVWQIYLQRATSYKQEMERMASTLTDDGSPMYSMENIQQVTRDLHYERYFEHSLHYAKGIHRVTCIQLYGEYYCDVGLFVEAAFIFPLVQVIRSGATEMCDIENGFLNFEEIIEKFIAEMQFVALRKYLEKSLKNLSLPFAKVPGVSDSDVQGMIDAKKVLIISQITELYLQEFDEKTITESDRVNFLGFLSENRELLEKVKNTERIARLINNHGQIADKKLISLPKHRVELVESLGDAKVILDHEMKSLTNPQRKDKHLVLEIVEKVIAMCNQPSVFYDYGYDLLNEKRHLAEAFISAVTKKSNIDPCLLLPTLFKFITKYEQYQSDLRAGKLEGNHEKHSVEWEDLTEVEQHGTTTTETKRSILHLYNSTSSSARLLPSNLFSNPNLSEYHAPKRRITPAHLIHLIETFIMDKSCTSKTIHNSLLILPFYNFHFSKKLKRLSPSIQNLLLDFVKREIPAEDQYRFLYDPLYAVRRYAEYYQTTNLGAIQVDRAVLSVLMAEISYLSGHNSDAVRYIMRITSEADVLARQNARVKRNNLKAFFRVIKTAINREDLNAIENIITKYNSVKIGQLQVSTLTDEDYKRVYTDLINRAIKYATKKEHQERTIREPLDIHHDLQRRLGLIIAYNFISEAPDCFKWRLEKEKRIELLVELYSKSKLVHVKIEHIVPLMPANVKISPSHFNMRSEQDVLLLEKNNTIDNIRLVKLQTDREEFRESFCDVLLKRRNCDANSCIVPDPVEQMTDRNVSFEPFFVFSCGHQFHYNCLTEMTKYYSGKTPLTKLHLTQKLWKLQNLNEDSVVWLEKWSSLSSLGTRITNLVNGVDHKIEEDKLINQALSRLLKKIKVISDIERIVGAECPLCGTLAVNTVRSTVLDSVDFPFKKHKHSIPSNFIPAKIPHNFLPRRRLDKPLTYFNKKNSRRLEITPL